MKKQKVISCVNCIYSEYVEESCFNDNLMYKEVEPTIYCNHPTKSNDGTYLIMIDYFEDDEIDIAKDCNSYTKYKKHRKNKR